MLELAYDGWQLCLIKVTVAALALVVGLTTTAPSIQHSILVKCDGVEVTTVDLDNLGAHVS